MSIFSRNNKEQETPVEEVKKYYGYELDRELTPAEKVIYDKLITLFDNHESSVVLRAIYAARVDSHSFPTIDPTVCVEVYWCYMTNLKSVSVVSAEDGNKLFGIQFKNVSREKPIIEPLIAAIDRHNAMAEAVKIKKGMDTANALLDNILGKE